MRERWHALDRQTRLVILLAVGFVVFRTAVASLSGFGFHQGWNEGHYALIASGFLEHPLIPKYGSRYVYSVPPLFPYVVSGSFLIFGESILTARLPSIIATSGVILATYELGRTVYKDATIAVTGAVILATLPYVQLFGGRVQTDALMVFLSTAALTAIVRGYQRRTNYRRWLFVGGALFAAAFATKQPAALVAGIVLFWLIGNQRFDRETVERTGVLIGSSVVFLLPVATWLLFNYFTAPQAFIADWRHELFQRTELFANVRLLFAIAFGLGMTPPVLAGAAIGVGSDIYDSMTKFQQRVTEDPGPSVLTWWLLLYGAFVLARTPHGHQYYAAVLTPPIALFAARGVHSIAASIGRIRNYRDESIKLALIILVIASTISGTLVLFELSGEFSVNEGGGTQVTADAGGYITSEIPDNATVLVSNGYEPPLKWHVKDQLSLGQVETYRVSSLDKEKLQSVVKQSEGPVYLVYPQPSWGDLPNTGLTQVHETSPYEYTVMSVAGSYADTNSKFTFYLNDRRLTIYRVSRADHAVNIDSRSSSPSARRLRS